MKTTATNDIGVTFNVVFTPNDENPGEGKVVFYDDRYHDAPAWRENGQPVSSYCVGTLLGWDGFYGSAERSGLCLHGGVSSWYLDHEPMSRVYDWLESQVTQ